MTTSQLDIFGGEKAHDIVIKERKEQEYRERVRTDPEYARRSLILGCLNRRGPLPEHRIATLLGMARLDVSAYLADLRRKELVATDGSEFDGVQHAWIWRAMSKREE